MEELEHARARGAHIYAEVLGYSLNNDAFHMTTPLPSGESCIRAMREALADAKLAPEQIDVLVHPQSIVHSLVEFCDGSLIAQLGCPDMRIPIAYCLAWPARIDGSAPRLDLARTATLTFEEPDLARFPALTLARQALESGGAAPTVLNAANEVAVAAFLARGLSFAAIPALVEATLVAAMCRNWTKAPESIEEALSIDHDARSLAGDLLPEIAAKAS